MLVVVLCVLAALYLAAIMVCEAGELDEPTYLDVLGELYDEETR